MRPAMLLAGFFTISTTAAVCAVPTPVDPAPVQPAEHAPETDSERDARMAWWREARFGMFIHWGLYAVPGGVWQGKPVGSAGEWIMHIGRIPVAEYEPLIHQFNPVKFDADAWAKLASDAGMKYLVITTKHHDGFALFDSAVSDYDVTNTPFKRDIMSELAAACRRHGVRIGWYHSILDWRHPDYIPKRDWHTTDGSDSDFEQYVEYLRAQVTEILTAYGDIDVMWFDGEWDATWTHDHGLEMEALVRELQPAIVLNNRVDKERYASDYPDATRFGGDYGTPEQHIPATGLTGVDWETCMTMNDTWGWKTHDDNWKSVETLLHNLVDIASKGGNYLLNVGPTAEGLIPEPSIERLQAMGAWLEVNGESIYGTDASPFGVLAWGRCTQRALDPDTTRLYLHVFEWPSDNRLVIPGLSNMVLGTSLLASDTAVHAHREQDAVVVHLPDAAPDPIDTVVVLDIAGTAAVTDPPYIDVAMDQFTKSLDVSIVAFDSNAEIRYTMDGTAPTFSDPIAPSSLQIRDTTPLAVRHFHDGQPISGTRRRTLTKVTPTPGLHFAGVAAGVRYSYYEVDCNELADLDGATPKRTGVTGMMDIALRDREEHYGFRFEGLIDVPDDDLYTFTLRSDDGSRLIINGEVVIDHDGLHAVFDKVGHRALGRGLHRIEVTFFEKGGDEALDLWIESADMPPRQVDTLMLYHEP